MAWQPTAYSYPLLAGAVVAAALALFAWRRRSAPGAVALVALLAGVFVWSAAYAIELAVDGLPAKVFWAKVEYLGIVSVPLSWLALALGYTGRGGWATGRNLAALAAVPLVTLLLVWTNEAHGLVWSSTRAADADGGFAPLVVTHGAWFWVYLVYAYGLLVAATVLMAPQFARSLRLYRAQGVVLLVSILAPWIGNALYILGASPLPNLDPTPFAFLVGGVGVSVAMFRYRFLDLVPVARASVVEAMGDGVIVVDPAGRVVDLNPAAERMISRPSDEAVGEEAEGLVPGWKGLFGGQDRAGEVRGEVSTGEGETRRYYSVRISPVGDGGPRRGHLALLSDVTARRRTEEALRESELRLKTIVANVPVILFALDQKGTFMFSEGKGLETLGLQPGGIVGLSVFEVYLDAPGILEDVRRALSGEAFSSTRETAGRTYETWYSPLPAEDGGLAGTIGVAVDITDRRRAEEEREERAAELEQFAYSVSHDLRAPLRAIAGFSQILVDDYAPSLDEEGKDYLLRVRDGARRMGRLIDDLLELSHLTRREMHPEEVDLGALARRVADDIVRAEPARAVELRVRDVPPAKGDPYLLKAVLEHLIGNAFKFTSKQPKATVEFGFDRDEGAYYVRDDGAGFDMEYADKLFGAFQRLHGTNEFEGTGIGLATVQRIVHRHGGRVWAEGRVGEGATFFFTLQ